MSIKMKYYVNDIDAYIGIVLTTYTKEVFFKRKTKRKMAVRRKRPTKAICVRKAMSKGMSKTRARVKCKVKGAKRR